MTTPEPTTIPELLSAIVVKPEDRVILLAHPDALLPPDEMQALVDRLGLTGRVLVVDRRGVDARTEPTTNPDWHTDDLRAARARLGDVAAEGYRYADVTAFVECVDALTAAGWTPAQPGDTPGQVEPDDARPGHGMIPGSHERPDGPECRCGAAWDRWSDRCAADARPQPITCYRCGAPVTADEWRWIDANGGRMCASGSLAGELHVVQPEAREKLTSLVANVLAIAADLDDDGPHRLPLSPRKLAAALRSLTSPGLDPAMNDGWTLRMLTAAMTDMERMLIAQGFEMGSVGDGPYPPWEVAMSAIDRLTRERNEARDRLCPGPNRIRCEAGKAALLDVSAAGHDSISAVVAERDAARAEAERLTVELVNVVERADGITIHRDQVERERDELGRLVVETRIASGNPDGATPLPAVVATLTRERDAERERANAGWRERAAMAERAVDLADRLAEAESERDAAVHAANLATSSSAVAQLRDALGHEGVVGWLNLLAEVRQIKGERERADGLARDLEYGRGREAKAIEDMRRAIELRRLADDDAGRLRAGIRSAYDAAVAEPITTGTCRCGRATVASERNGRIAALGALLADSPETAPNATQADENAEGVHRDTPEQSEAAQGRTAQNEPRQDHTTRATTDTPQPQTHQ